MKYFSIIIKNLCFVILFYTIPSSAQVTDDSLVIVHSVTTTEMNTLSPESGCLVYNTEKTSLYVFNGMLWEKYKSDGSETKIIAGDNITITGSGTIADPYIVSAIKPTLTDNGDGTYTFSNGIDPDVTFTAVSN